MAVPIMIGDGKEEETCDIFLKIPFIILVSFEIFKKNYYLTSSTVCHINNIILINWLKNR